jgi:hypothetical protein
VQSTDQSFVMTWGTSTTFSTVITLAGAACTEIRQLISAATSPNETCHVNRSGLKMVSGDICVILCHHKTSALLDSLLGRFCTDCCLHYLALMHPTLMIPLRKLAGYLMLSSASSKLVADGTTPGETIRATICRDLNWRSGDVWIRGLNDSERPAPHPNVFNVIECDRCIIM